jgi:hypothetical protein
VRILEATANKTDNISIRPTSMVFIDKIVTEKCRTGHLLKAYSFVQSPCECRNVYEWINHTYNYQMNITFKSYDFILRFSNYEKKV